MTQNSFSTSKKRYVKVKTGRGMYSYWVEYDKKTGQTTDLTWKQAKTRFGEAYDKKLARRLAKIHGTTQKVQYARIRNARATGISFGDLY